MRAHAKLSVRSIIAKRQDIEMKQVVQAAASPQSTGLAFWIR